MIQIDAAKRSAVGELCARYGFARLEIFGSAARGEDHEDSDIDILYELAPGRHLTWEVVDAADELASILGRPVDLVSKSAVHPLLRERIEAEARALHAA